jgi:hypothetical protein
MPARSSLSAGLVAVAMAVMPALAVAAGSSARPASRSERSALIASLVASDGSSVGVRGVYVSRSNPSLAVVCVRTPDAGTQAFVFGRAGRSWRYVTSGRAGSAGSSADRRLEHACG